MSDTADAHPVTNELPEFDVATSDLGGGVLSVAVVGAVDMQTAPPMAQALEQAQRDSSAVQLDLTAVSFLGSSGLSVMVDGTRRAADSGGKLAILATSHAVLRAMEVTGLDSVLTVFQTPEEAAAFLSA